ncbi:hypothetical protein KL930_005288 [Ogataea haglerorum]|uniref:Uncharacterized protein n=1 Tax=Ogataea haglerorum TaxID=1937702 RepID=A0AAN6D0J8_9ASCO|nr:hypothetical protein KL915_005308 [Ogataea haglerorum]KAG7702206.1 hypothetical protein KL914_005337 [Ogataea haglerorum]KAG7702276.1 hypothetical protein KL950_005326 [Ogataea haglerorum]KAG7723843.1 hypothetical protein KL933_005318 [Ogataea haglerorum]KAG7724455.1 hypothetical protein KL948_005298 [Ogataea haglerorum]
MWGLEFLIVDHPSLARLMLISSRVLDRPTVGYIKRHLSNLGYSKQDHGIFWHEEKLSRARNDCMDLLQKHDVSSYLLSKFYPKEFQDIFLVVKAFNSNLAKIALGSSIESYQFTKLKFGFWQEQLDRCERDMDISDSSNSILPRNMGEPVVTLARECLRKGIRVNFENLRQMIASYQHFCTDEGVRGFKDTYSICSFGEGIFSQMNYALRDALFSPKFPETSRFSLELMDCSGRERVEILLNDIYAHIGQSTAIASFLLGSRYYATSRSQVLLPLESIAKRNISQEDVLRYLQSEDPDQERDEEVREIVFDVATVANDHLLTARTKFNDLKGEIHDLVDKEGSLELKLGWEQLNHGVPDAMFLPMMNGLPTICFLEKLEKYDFEIRNPNLNIKDWRLAWKTYRSYSNRVI